MSGLRVPGESGPQPTAAEAELTAHICLDQTGLRKWSLATTCPHLAVPLGQGRTRHFSTGDPGWLILCPFWGLGNPSSHHTWGMDSCLPEPAGRRTQGQTRGRPSWGHPGSSVAGRQAGRQIGEGVFGAWQTQGLIAGASPGLTLAPALELRWECGQAWPLPYSSPWATPCFPPPISGALGRVLVGGCGASLSLPGHLGGIRPADGTGPVGL